MIDHKWDSEKFSCDDDDCVFLPLDCDHIIPLASVWSPVSMFVILAGSEVLF